ncbi:response regulator transcription factor [Xanthomonas sp. XNM01]|uniref:response regulator transcription factor n=1 Tax=Xanthomonas sp. XNM01 TaxID=2769289 RepID=UPI001783E75D|nr:response regulator transcription factor [Xanthomonas sp. XNM01]MBD9369706.1 response regulator transcription factor [Xanthomonas sp. XNM01]
MRILLAEDDIALAARIRSALEEAGFVVVHAADGVDAEYQGQVEEFDAAVVDLGLPDLDGLSVLERWRAAGRDLPVLVLTARARWHDKLAGFDAGADDYLTKPFQVEELLLRLRALIRRSAGHAHPRLQCGPLQLDINAGRFDLDGMPLALTAHEHRILAYFMHHPEVVISRARLGEHVYEAGFDPDSNTLDVLIGRIRRKLGEANLIHTVRGQGFRLSASA